MRYSGTRNVADVEETNCDNIQAERCLNCRFGIERATLNLDLILSELKSQRKRIDHAIVALEGTAVAASEELATSVRKARRRTWKMSAEARKQISDAKKKWWAKRKKLKLT